MLQISKIKTALLLNFLYYNMRPLNRRLASKVSGMDTYPYTKASGRDTPNKSCLTNQYYSDSNTTNQ